LNTSSFKKKSFGYEYKPTKNCLPNSKCSQVPHSKTTYLMMINLMNTGNIRKAIIP